MADRPGGIFVRVADQISSEDRILLQTVARIIISVGAGELSYQVGKRNLAQATHPPPLYPVQPYFHANWKVAVTMTRNTRRPAFLQWSGGLLPRRKGISSSPRPAAQSTPAPWINVLANPNFGTVISEGGQSYTWMENAHEFRLTPWNNDPVSDTAGETFYIRDEESSIFWSPSPLPARGKIPLYRTRPRLRVYSISNMTRTAYVRRCRYM